MFIKKYSKLYIILSLFIIFGCERRGPINMVGYSDETDWSTSVYNCDNYFIEMHSYLYRDNNGYYHLQFLETDYSQTYTTLSTNTGSIHSYQKVKFLSNKEIFLYDNWINVINSSSYTDDIGIASGVMGVWDQFIDDTIKVYSGYQDECGNSYIDSIEVVIDEI